jgi:hypothetical protein
MSHIKLLLLIYAALLSGTTTVLSDNPILRYPLEAEFKYEEDIKVTLKGADRQMSLVYTENGRSASVPVGELRDIHNPMFSTISFQKVFDDETGKTLAVITLEFARLPAAWGSTVREVSFYFADGAYSSRRIKIPTGENTWRYTSKGVGKPEVPEGRGGAIPKVSPEE